MYMEGRKLSAEDQGFKEDKENKKRDFLPEDVDQSREGVNFSGGSNKDLENVFQTAAERKWAAKGDDQEKLLEDEIYQENVDKARGLAKGWLRYFRDLESGNLGEPYDSYLLEKTLPTKSVVELKNKKHSKKELSLQEIEDWFAKGGDGREMMVLAVQEELREQGIDPDSARLEAKAVVRDMESSIEQVESNKKLRKAA